MALPSNINSRNPLECRHSNSDFKTMFNVWFEMKQTSPAWTQNSFFATGHRPQANEDRRQISSKKLLSLLRHLNRLKTNGEKRTARCWREWCTQWFLIWLWFHLLLLRSSQHRNLFSLCMLCCLCHCLGIYWSSRLWLGCILVYWMVRTEWNDRRSKTERDAQNWF